MKLPYNAVVSARPAEGGCLHEGPGFAIGWRVFQPGETFPAHHHTSFEEIFIGLSGVLTVAIDGAAGSLGPGDRVVVERGRVHSLANTGAEPAEISYLKIPFVPDDTIWDCRPTDHHQQGEHDARDHPPGQ
jgi:quercetin dioxygenase-like cupin family protein